MTSIAQQVARRGVAGVVAALALAGLGTGAALHRRAEDGLDRALEAQAHAAMAQVDGHVAPRPPDGQRWHPEHGPPPIDAFVLRGPDPRVPEPLRQHALRHEHPIFADVDDHRLALVVAERGPEHAEEHVLLVARAPAETLVRSIGPFAALYAAFATAAALLASAALQSAVADALAPVRRARDEAGAVLGLGDGARLSTAAPDELRDLLVAFNEALDRLDDAGRAQGRFTAEAAHELRTPVTALLGELDVTLRRDRTAEAYRDALLSARDEVERLRRIVDALTALARLDAGEADVHREPARAADLAQRVAEAEPTVTVEVGADPELDVHPGLLSVALANLVRNAHRHAPGAAVVLRVDATPTHAVFTALDDGPGLPPGDPEALFDRFTRGASSRARDAQGLGLGLPLARQIARRHGGDCTLAPRPEGGVAATLTVRLPA